MSIAKKRVCVGVPRTNLKYTIEHAILVVFTLVLFFKCWLLQTKITKEMMGELHGRKGRNFVDFSTWICSYIMVNSQQLPNSKMNAFQDDYHSGKTLRETSTKARILDLELACQEARLKEPGRLQNQMNECLIYMKLRRRLQCAAFIKYHSLDNISLLNNSWKLLHTNFKWNPHVKSLSCNFSWSNAWKT